MPPASASKPATRTTTPSRQSRLGAALLSGAKTVAVSIFKTMYVLWLEITGVAFAAFAIMGGSSLIGLYRKQAWLSDKHRFWTTVGFTIVCVWLTVMSFWRARRTRK